MLNLDLVVDVQMEVGGGSCKFGLKCRGSSLTDPVRLRNGWILCEILNGIDALCNYTGLLKLR